MTRDEAWSMMLQVAGIEQACIELRKIMCDGSFLHGHTVKQEITDDMVRKAWVEMDTIAQRLDGALARMGARP